MGYASRLAHGVIGKGINDYDAIFSTLSQVGFNSWISMEDGMNGLDELRESLRFLTTKIDRSFSAATGWHREFGQPHFFDDFPSLTQDAAHYLIAR